MGKPSSRHATKGAFGKNEKLLTPEQRRKRIGRKALKAVRSWCKK